ncbi:MAG: NUDIX hydrolase, partial [Patescibacteria group bacterium]|nr:NUDIX hydrolase [Patescibacteria group bacterium]
IPPYKNKWNLPGGIVFKTEKLSDAAKKVAKEELNLAVKLGGFLESMRIQYAQDTIYRMYFLHLL